MVLRHFKLREQPFGVTPDPRYLYASSTHREALASLLYGIESGLGFVTLTAKPGMGKTTLLFEALRRMQETARTVFLFQTIASPIDLVRALLIDLGVKETQGTLVELQTQLNEVLVSQAATGKRLIVVIDEAQNLDESVLEAVRMLSNFETARQKLMQIILAGQLQLADKLAEPRLLQLRQRISIFAHLQPLSATETAAYIEHRLHVAGHDANEALFTPSALTLIAKESQGIPRNINNICFNSLTLACALQRKKIDVEILREVLADLDFTTTTASSALPQHSETVIEKKTNSPFTSRPPMLQLRTVLIPSAVLAIAAFFAWLIMQDYRALSADGTVAANSSAAPGASAAAAAGTVAAPPADSTARTQSPVLRPGYVIQLVPVRNGQSLYAVCTQTFGECRPEILREIIKINPSISDPNRILTKKKVAVPVLLPNPAGNK